jgi:tetratricopeptide (TPR) repeat protein
MFGRERVINPRFVLRSPHLCGEVLLVLLSAGIISPLHATDTIPNALRAARTLIDEGRPALAIEKLQALGASSDPSIAHMLGVAFYHANQPVKAIELLGPVLEKLPEGSLERREATQVLGLSRYLAGHLPEAIPLLEQTRAWAPDNTELAYVLGMAYIQTRQPERARESFGRMFRVEAESAAAHLLTAQMMIRLEFEDFAEAELKKALEKDARLPQAHFLLGQIAIFRARLDEGIEHMQRELDVNPGNSMAFYRLGDALTRQLKWDEAISALQKSVWLNPYYSGPYILMGKAYIRKKQPAAAEGMLRRAIQFDPNNKSAHYMLGQVLQDTGRSDEAKREFDIAERLNGEPDR